MLDLTFCPDPKKTKFLKKNFSFKKVKRKMIDAFNHKENKIKLLAVMVVKVFLGLTFFSMSKSFLILD